MTDGKPRSRKKPAAPESTSSGVWWRRFAKNLGGAPRTREDLMEILGRSYTAREIQTALLELEQAEVIGRDDSVPKPAKVPAGSFPLQRIVLNVTPPPCE